MQSGSRYHIPNLVSFGWLDRLQARPSTPPIVLMKSGWARTSVCVFGVPVGARRKFGIPVSTRRKLPFLAGARGASAGIDVVLARVWHQHHLLAAPTQHHGSTWHSCLTRSVGPTTTPVTGGSIGAVVLLMLRQPTGVFLLAIARLATAVLGDVPNFATVVASLSG